MSAQNWPVQERILDLKTRWLTLIGETLKTPQGTLLEYWRIEKADSVIVLPIYQQQLLLPPASYRPGLGQCTWDFPGGRCPLDQTPYGAALAALQRELQISASALNQMRPLNQEGWAINSSFSNQCLYGFVAEIKSDCSPPATNLGAYYPTTSEGIQALLAVLTCLQCRTVLLEWWMTHHGMADTFSGNDRTETEEIL